MSKQITTSRRKPGTPTEKRATRHKTERAGSRTRPRRSWAALTPPVRVVGALIAGLVVGTFMSLGLQKVIAEPPEQARRWEYSRFAFALAGVSWSTPDRHYAAEETDDLYRYIANSDPQGDITSVDIANLIGSRGWELVSVNYSEDPRGDDNYWFKRSID